MRIVRRYGELLKRRNRSILFKDSETELSIFIPITQIVAWGFLGSNILVDESICDDDTLEDTLIWVDIPQWLAKKELLT